MSGSVQNFEFLARRQAYKNVIDVYDDNMRGDLDSWYGKKAIKRNRNNKEFEPYLKDSNYRLSNTPKKDVVILGSPIYVALSD